MELRRKVMEMLPRHDKDDHTKDKYFYITRDDGILHASHYEDVASDSGSGIYVVEDSIPIDMGYPADSEGEGIVVYGISDSKLLLKDEKEIDIVNKPQYKPIYDIYKLLMEA